MQTRPTPEKFLCKISGKLLNDPVLISLDGKTASVVDKSFVPAGVSYKPYDLLKQEIIKWKADEERLAKEKQQLAIQEEKHNPKRGNASYDFLLKLKLIGDPGVGKSSLLLRFADGTYTPSFITTIGMDFKVKTLHLHNKDVKTYIYDEGDERFKPTLQVSAQGYVLAFDLIDRLSFLNVEKHYNKHFSTMAPNDRPIIFLVGTKSDLKAERLITQDEIDAMLKKLDLSHYVETSAKADINVTSLFNQIASMWLLKVSSHKIPVAISEEKSGLSDTKAQILKQLNDTIADLAKDPSKNKNKEFLIKLHDQLKITDISNSDDVANFRNKEILPALNPKNPMYAELNKFDSWFKFSFSKNAKTTTILAIEKLNQSLESLIKPKLAKVL